ncbi:MAG: uroporphyrinogen-III C-methyltransferase, partial [Rubricella sp.]
HGLRVARLKGGDPAVFGRLDDEVEACDAAGVSWEVVPGITTASAAAASLGQSLTRRGRNKDVRFLTGHDVKGLAEQDWKALAAPGAVAAIYMGKRAATFLRGRLMIHGAGEDTPVTVIENVSRPDQRILPARLIDLPDVVADLAGPAILMLGLEPRRAAAAVPALTPRIKEAL